MKYIRLNKIKTLASVLNKKEDNIKYNESVYGTRDNLSIAIFAR